MLLPILLALAAAQPVDPDTRAWWNTTIALSDDRLDGRDTGSPGHAKAARMVADRFRKAGLKPAGEKGGWFQTIALDEVAIDRPGTAVSIGGRPLKLLYDLTFRPSPGMPTAVDAVLAFRGYCGAQAMGDVRGKVVLCYGTRKAELPQPAERLAAARAGGAVGLLTIADPAFTVEPPRWPFAYARTVTLAGTPPPDDDALLIGTVNVDALRQIVAGTEQIASGLISAGKAGWKLPNFDLPFHFRAAVAIKRRSYTSENVLAVLPGTDPALAGEHVVLSAHLDGYGLGEAVKGDGVYNGALDDAAYVALLTRLAERRQGKGWRRPVIFAAFTGEEKGLLGARAFVANPTVPRGAIVANLNLDQIRPIFPLELLTVHAIGDTTLGDDAAAVAQAMGVAVQPDPEPERNLLRRADHWPFLQAGIPATGFVFGYRPGGESERLYRGWYNDRYHKPQDDVRTSLDWKAAADFNGFFYRLVDRVADGARPAWKAGSALRPAVAPAAP